MFLPIGDTQVIGGHKPYVSYTLIVINIIVWFVQLSVPGNLVCEWAAIPIDIVKGTSYLTLITSIFMHGSWMHLIGNMLFLWIFADNIEAKIGSLKFLIYYLAGGIVASLTHIYFSTASSVLSMMNCLPCSVINPCADITQMTAAVIPSLGASGAISAVMGAYLLMFPSSKTKVLVVILFTSFEIPTVVFLGIWFIQQLMSGLGTLEEVTAASAGVAWWAHIGGFVFGIIAGVYLKKYNTTESSVRNEDYV